MQHIPGTEFVWYKFKSMRMHEKAWSHWDKIHCILCLFAWWICACIMFLWHIHFIFLPCMITEQHFVPARCSWKLYYLLRFLLQGLSSLNSMLEENLHSALTSLPRLMRTVDDTKKIQSLNLVLGYLSLLGNRLSNLLNSSSHLKRLSLALVQVSKDY